MELWSEVVFHEKVRQAVDHLRLVLHGERHLKPADSVPHRYEDKFTLAEHLADTAISAALQIIGFMGQGDDTIERLHPWANSGSAVTLRFQIESAVKFEEEVTRREDDHDEKVLTHSSLFGTTKTTQKTVKIITEYRHARLFVYRLFAFAGADPTNPMAICSREIRFDQLLPNRTTESSTSSVERYDVNVTFLLRHCTTRFSVNRQANSCKTPRRNEDVERCIRQFRQLDEWAELVLHRFESLLFENLPQRPREADIQAESIFVPVLPVFNEGADSVHLSDQDRQALLSEHGRLLKEKFSDLDSSYRDAVALQSYDVKRLLLLNQLHRVCNLFQDSLDFIEHMLYSQLKDAIGKHLDQSDFNAFMRVHNRKIFRDEFVPIPFCFAVRRPEHAPEGVFTLRESGGGDPVLSQLRLVPEAASHTISFPINAATTIPFEGERFLHCCVFSNFEKDEKVGLPSLELSARACQFSTYILLVGSMTSARMFQPKSAIIIKNKDEVVIPVLLHQMPSAKEFRDAIESLSPEQQRFCKAFRAMQLESSLFAICAIQIKPQLELVLGLPDDSLTKEIQLAQDLMELFMKYQIPSDLLAFNGDPNATVADKLDAVRESVANIKKIISDARSVQLVDAQQEAAYMATTHPEELVHAPPPPCVPSAYSAPLMRIATTSAAVPGSARARLSYPIQDCGISAKPSAVKSAACSIAVRSPIAFQQANVLGTGAAQPILQQQQQQQPQNTAAEDGHHHVAVGSEFVQDFTKLPALIDRQLELLDKSGHLRPTRLQLQSPFARTRQATLLSEPSDSQLDEAEQTRERNAAFDLLDALSKSGTLPIRSASLHVLVALTHNFCQSLVDTVIQENVNPIEGVERSLLITSATLHQIDAAGLIRPEFFDQIQTSSDLFPLESDHVAGLSA